MKEVKESPYHPLEAYFTGTIPQQSVQACIPIQDLIDCGQFSLPTTYLPGVRRFTRVLLCSIPYTDFGEFTFHALG